MLAYTDYPIVELGDTEGEIAPVRKVEVIDWDGDKYCTVEIDGVKNTLKIKRGYLYSRPGRVGEVPVINPERFIMS